MPLIDPVEFSNALEIIRDYCVEQNAPPSVDGAISLLEEVLDNEQALRIQRWLSTFDHALSGSAGVDPSTARSRAKSHADAAHGLLPPGVLATIF